jgi:hypothetical protein
MPAQTLPEPFHLGNFVSFLLLLANAVSGALTITSGVKQQVFSWSFFVSFFVVCA